MNFESDSSTNRMARNGMFVAARQVVYFLSNAILVWYLVRKYGWGPYGLIALATFLTKYVGLVARSVGNSIARFLAIALNQNDWKQANEIFSTALVANIGFALLQVPIYVLGIWHLDWIIDFPPDKAADFRILVLCNVIIFLFSMVMGVVRTPIQAANRLDLSSNLDMARLILRLVLLVGLIETVGARLWIIGVIDLGLALANGIAIYVLYRKLARKLVFKWKYVTKKWVMPVSNMAVWSIVTSLGGYLLVGSDVWMINRFVSKEMAGVYAALLVCPNAMKQISKQFASILAPVYIIDYARGDSDRVARISLSSAKLIGCFVALCAGVLCVGAEPLLRLWPGNGAEAYVPLFRVMILYLAYTIGESVLWQIYVTLNKVHISGIISLGSGVINIVLSLILIHLGFGTMGVAIATVVSMLLASAVAIPVGVCREFKMPLSILGWNYFYITILLLISLGATHVAMVCAAFSPVLGVIALVGLMFAGCLPVYFFIFTPAEKIVAHRLRDKVLSMVFRSRNTSAEPS